MGVPVDGATATESGERDRAVIVAVVPVRVVQVAVDQVVDVVTVRHCGVTASGSVHVVGVVTRAGVRPAAVRIGRAHRDGVFIVVVLVRAVQVTVVQVPDVIVVTDRDVATVGAVLVVVVLVDLVHRCLRTGLVSLQGYGSVRVIEDVLDEGAHVAIRQGVEPRAPVGPSVDEVLGEEDPQSV